MGGIAEVERVLGKGDGRGSHTLLRIPASWAPSFPRGTRVRLTFEASRIVVTRMENSATDEVDP